MEKLMEMLQRNEGAAVDAKKRLRQILTSDIRMVCVDLDDINRAIRGGYAMRDDEYERDVMQYELDFMKAVKVLLGR